uniref:Uncharacterized protein n=1 Tax=Anguilla anguilla TaxID=7936 RepID=A0A0E9SSM3_ANGAN
MTGRVCWKTWEPQFYPSEVSRIVVGQLQIGLIVYHYTQLN